MNELEVLATGRVWNAEQLTPLCPNCNPVLEQLVPSMVAQFQEEKASPLMQPIEHVISYPVFPNRYDPQWPLDNLLLSSQSTSNATNSSDSIDNGSGEKKEQRPTAPLAENKTTDPLKMELRHCEVDSIRRGKANSR
ncbi:MAG: hypothetical protein GY822_28575 [Deltaproteobacteria bacterium]|nr:hypothetical protein [Deltaproteobacteria bacterium]